MDKTEYFPRKKLFEEVQELAATFYSTGDYLTDEASEYATMLDEAGNRDEFYYSLLLLSMLSGINSLIKITDRVIRNMSNRRIKRKVTSVEGFAGEIDIEEYIRRNYAEKANPREYPSVISVSTFQLPEYQLTLWVLRHCENMYHQIFSALGDCRGVRVFDMARQCCERLHVNAGVMQKRYRVSYSRKESYQSLKKKVVYRYKNRKVITPEYKELIRLFEKIVSLKGIDCEVRGALNIFNHSEAFDDRLFEIWLIRRCSELIAKRAMPKGEKIVYRPLYKARRDNTYAVSIPCVGYRIEILFQNRKKFMPKKELMWYWNNGGVKEEIGAIPDLVFFKFMDGADKPEEIVLMDAKNRKWVFAEDAQRIKGEIVQQIYIRDSFSALFTDKFKSILVAHNVEGYQSRKYNHKMKPGYEIDVISLDFRESQTEASLDALVSDLCCYLGV